MLAIDPSSPFTGGALLGDRVRMQQHATDEGVFIRSMASAVTWAGWPGPTPQAVRVLDGGRFHVVLIETVGVGQAEAAIAAMADMIMVIVAPAWSTRSRRPGGHLEIGDVLAVNKRQAGAQEAVRDLRGMIAMARRGEGDWKPPIVSTTAAAGEGIGDLVARLDEHRAWLDRSGEGERRRRARAREEISVIALAGLRARMGGLPGDERIDGLAGRVAAGELDPFAAAEELIAGA